MPQPNEIFDSLALALAWQELTETMKRLGFFLKKNRGLGGFTVFFGGVQGRTAILHFLGCLFLAVSFVLSCYTGVVEIQLRKALGRSFF